MRSWINPQKSFAKKWCLDICPAHWMFPATTPVPVLRSRRSLSVTRQRGFFFYGIDRNEQVTWLHPPAWAMIWSTVQTICWGNSYHLWTDRRALNCFKSGMIQIKKHGKWLVCFVWSWWKSFKNLKSKESNEKVSPSFCHFFHNRK